MNEHASDSQDPYEEVEHLRHLLAEAWGWIGVKPAPAVKGRVDDLLDRISDEVADLL